MTSEEVIRAMREAGCRLVKRTGKDGLTTLVFVEEAPKKPNRIMRRKLKRKTKSGNQGVGG